MSFHTHTPPCLHCVRQAIMSEHLYSATLDSKEWKCYQCQKFCPYIQERYKNFAIIILGTCFARGGFFCDDLCFQEWKMNKLRTLPGAY